MAEVINGKLVHSAQVINGRTFCTDCGAHLRVGSYEAMAHGGDHGRKACPNVPVASTIFD